MANPLRHIAAPANVSPLAPLTLASAARIAFPDGRITARSLRSEREKGNLATFKVANKVMTTLSAIDEMIERCQDQSQQGAPPKASASTCDRPAKTVARSTSFATDRKSTALAAAQMTALALSKRLQPTSRQSTAQETGKIIPMRS